jgi:hypothetical protein
MSTLFLKNTNFCGNQILCSSMAQRVFSRLIGIIPFSKNSMHLKGEISSSFLNKFKKKMIVTISRNLAIYGRMNESVPHFQEAIILGNYSARADFALVCFTANLPHQMCKHAFELLKSGRDYGCPDCTGMLAFYYVTGCRGVTHRCDDTAYSLACHSAATGSWFGKWALVHFLNTLCGDQDPDEEKFDLHWMDHFVCNFAPEAVLKAVPDAADDADADAAADANTDYWVGTPFQDWSESDFEDWFEDPDILSQLDIYRLAEILIKQIKEEHLLNPHMPKVWSNLPVLKLYH